MKSIKKVLEQLAHLFGKGGQGAVRKTRRPVRDWQLLIAATVVVFAALSVHSLIYFQNDTTEPLTIDTGEDTQGATLLRQRDLLAALELYRERLVELETLRRVEPTPPDTGVKEQGGSEAASDESADASLETPEFD